LVTAFLTEDWLEEAAAAFAVLPDRPGIDADVQYVISGAPGGKVQVCAAVRSGRITELAVGKHDDPDCTVTLSYADAVALFLGELGPEVAYMSGRVKIDGDHRIWVLDMRPIRGDGAVGAALSALREASTT
jgi:putative sterol carrier protein